MDKRTAEPIRKVFGVPLSKSFKKAKDGTLTVRGYFTSDNKDMAGDIITRAATERAIPAYKQWGNIRYMHLPRPVAKVIGIGSLDGLAWNEVEIKVIDPQAVFEVENGLLSALSVGILISVEDIDFLETGGMIINDYKLAEISLVDHPANYDARLKTFSIEQGLSVLAGNFGMDALARGMKSLIETEMTMEEEKTPMLEETPAIETETEAEVEKELEPTEEVSEEPVEDLVEAPVEEETVEADKAVEPEATEDAPAPEFATVSQMEEVKSMLQALTSTVQDLAKSFAAFSKSLDEADAEAPAQEQADGDTEAEKELSTETELPETESEAGPAANRKGAGEETVLPDEKDIQKTEDVTDLRAALHKYFTTSRR